MTANVQIENALVVKFEGKLVSSNLEEWKENALKAHGEIKADPKTPEEYGQAKKDMVYCKDVETRIDDVKGGIMEQAADLLEAFNVMDGVKSAHSKTRLALDKKIKAYTAKRKGEMLSAAVAKVKNAVQPSVVSYAFKMDEAAFTKAIKGKSAEASIQKALDEEVHSQLTALGEMIGLYGENITLIVEAEKDWPSLCRDKKTLALKSTEYVQAELSSRIAEQKLALKEAQERAEREAKEKAEREAKAKAECEAREKAEAEAKAKAEREAAEAERKRQEEEAAKAKSEPPAFEPSEPPKFEEPATSEPPKFEEAPDCEVSFDIPAPKQEEPKAFVLHVKVQDNDIVHAIEKIRMIPEVLFVEEY